MKARVAVVIALLAAAAGGIIWLSADDDPTEETVATESDAPASVEEDTAAAAPDEAEPEVVGPTGFGEFPGQPFLFPWGDGFLELLLAPAGPGDGFDVRASVSADGVSWQPVDTAFPDLPEGYVSTAAVAGQRLVLSYGTWGPNGASSAPMLLVTEDLATWQQITLPAPDPATLPDLMMSQSQVDAIAATDTGWLAVQTSHQFFEPERFLPIDPMDFESGYGIGITPDGIDFDPEGGERQLFTWEELGIDPDVGAELAFGPGTDDVTFWYADWGDEPTPVEIDNVQWVSSLASNGSEFVATVSGETESRLLRSADGRSWEQFDADPVGEVAMVAPIEGGYVAQTWRRSGPALSLSDDGGASWRTVDATGLPESDQISLHSPISSASPGVATVAFLHDIPDFAAELPAVTYEHDGFSITVQDSQTTSAVTIVDIETGEVVLEATHEYPSADEIRALEEAGDTEALDALVFGEPPWRTHGERTTDFVDPTSSEVIVQVPWEVEGAAFDEVFREFDQRQMDPGPPEMWLIATADGISWLSVQLNQGEMFFSPGSAAINGSTVVVRVGDGHEVYDLAG